MAVEIFGDGLSQELNRSEDMGAFRIKVPLKKIAKAVARPIAKVMPKPIARKMAPPKPKPKPSQPMLARPMAPAARPNQPSLVMKPLPAPAAVPLVPEVPPRAPEPPVQDWDPPSFEVERTYAEEPLEDAPDELDAEDEDEAEESTMGYSYEGGQIVDRDELGWSLKPPKALLSKVKSVADVAQKVGPLVAVVNPPAGLAIAAAATTAKGVLNKDPKAIAAVATMATDAAKGIPAAKEALAAVEAAKAVQKNMIATKAIEKARSGDAKAQAQIIDTKKKADAGDPGAQKALVTLQAAHKGLKIKAAYDASKQGDASLEIVLDDLTRF